jgi:hypothetical protein
MMPLLTVQKILNYIWLFMYKESTEKICCVNLKFSNIPMSIERQ